MRRKPVVRAQRMIAPMLLLAGLAALVAVLGLPQLPPWLAWAPSWLVVALAAALTVVGIRWIEPWAVRRRAEADREQAIAERLREHLGRRAKLPKIGELAALPADLRIHQAIPLPASAVPDIGKQEEPNWRRWLRVRHHTIPDPYLPTFVEREVLPRVQQHMRDAATVGGFIVLVGNPTVGKTRLLYEAALLELPDFAVLAPDLGDGELFNELASATVSLPKLIVWLDELQRFLDGPYLAYGDTPITAAAVRQLLDAPTPIIIVATLWPEHYNTLHAGDTHPDTGQPRPRYPKAVDVLDKRRIRQVPVKTFTTTERQAAARLAAHDPRLAEALGNAGYNVTETLAGAHEQMRRYESGTTAQQAVIHAAVDARRLGIQSPLTDQLLAAAARGYLTSHHPEDDWYTCAITELLSDQHPGGQASCPLLPVTTPDRRIIVGYTVNDYLHHRLTQQRLTQGQSKVTWRALIDHTHDRDDLSRLGISAINRLFYSQAIAICRRLTTPGDNNAWLADLFVEHGRMDEAIRVLGDPISGFRILSLSALGWLADQLIQQGRTDEAAEVWRRLVDEDDVARLAKLVADLGSTGVAVEYLYLAELELSHAAELLAEGRVDKAVEVLSAVRQHDAARLIELLAEDGQIHKAVRILNDVLTSYDRIDVRLFDLLAEFGRIDELRERADAGDISAAERLADLLVEQGRIDELRERADARETSAAERLADLLVEQGRIDELRERADAGSREAAKRLGSLLHRRGRVDEAIEVLRVMVDRTDNSDGDEWLADLLLEQGRIDELRERADAGSREAAKRLGSLLHRQGRVDELRERADAGDREAAVRLTYVLEERGCVDELRARARTGDITCGWRLAELLAEHGRIDELRAEVHIGTPRAGERWLQTLTEQCEHGLADLIMQRGLDPDELPAEMTSQP